MNTDNPIISEFSSSTSFFISVEIEKDELPFLLMDGIKTHPIKDYDEEGVSRILTVFECDRSLFTFDEFKEWVEKTISELYSYRKVVIR